MEEVRRGGGTTWRRSDVVEGRGVGRLGGCCLLVLVCFVDAVGALLRRHVVLWTSPRISLTGGRGGVLWTQIVFQNITALRSVQSTSGGTSQGFLCLGSQKLNIEEG